MAKVTFPDEFWKKEVRCDFPIGEIMKRNWAAQIQVLEDVRELCERHDIRYFAAYGTLLGAVRHQGFIPWDDDVDILMVGEDYIRFLYYAKDELDQKYRLLNPYEDGGWTMTFSRINRRIESSFREMDLREWQNCPFSVGVDIFPFYYIPRDETKKRMVLDTLARIRNVERVNKFALERRGEGKEGEYLELISLVEDHLSDLIQMTGFPLQEGRSLDNQLEALFDQVCRFTLKEDGDEAACLYNYFGVGEIEKVPANIFEETVMLPFENISVPAPKDYHTLLVAQFDDRYMEFQKNTAGHDYPYFKKVFRNVRNKFEIYDLQKKRKKYGNNDADLTIPETRALCLSQNEKCVVLYYTGVREMAIYGEYVIDKIRSTLRYFEEHQDTMQLRWVPGSFEAVDYIPFSLIVPELMEDYRNLIKEFREKDFGICDESGDITAAIAETDCFYGDESLHSAMFRRTGRPVLIQDYHILDLGNHFREGFERALLSPLFPLGGGIGVAAMGMRNGLVQYNYEKKESHYLRLMEGDAPEKPGMFAVAVRFGEWVAFLPGGANEIVLYHPETEERKVFQAQSPYMAEQEHPLKFADAIVYGEYLYIFGERYAYIVRISLDGSIQWIPISENIFWKRRGVTVQGDLARIRSQNGKKILQFNLRTEEVIILDYENATERLDERSGVAPEKESKQSEVFRTSGWETYRDDVFEWYAREDSPLIHEQEDWIGLADLTDYVIWKKKQGVVQT